MKKRISSHILASLLAPLCSPSDEEWELIAGIDSSDTDRLTALILERVVPWFHEFDSESQKKIKDSLEFFIGTEESGVDRLFPAFHIPIEPPDSARAFLSIVWQEIFGTTAPCSADTSLFEKDNSDDFVNSLRRK